MFTLLIVFYNLLKNYISGEKKNLLECFYFVVLTIVVSNYFSLHNYQTPFDNRCCWHNAFAFTRQVERVIN